MQHLQCSLERWLGSPDNLARRTGWPRELSALQDGKITAFGIPTWEYTLEEWPPLTYLAELDHEHSDELWLILPCPIDRPDLTQAPLTEDSKVELRLSQKGRDLLQEILLGHRNPEFDALRKAFPVYLLGPSKEEADSHSCSWLIWKWKDDRSTSNLFRNWELLASVLDRLGIPPNTILDDWHRQLERWHIATPESNLRELLAKVSHRILVSKSGLLVPLSEFQLHPSGPGPNSIHRPATRRPTAPKPLAPTSSKPKPRRSDWWSTLILAGLGLGSATTALWQIRTNSEPLDPPKQSLAPSPSSLTHPPITQHALTQPAAIIDKQEDQPTELVRTEWTIDQASSVDAIVQDALEINVNLASFEPQPPKKEASPIEELPAPSGNETQNPRLDQAPSAVAPIEAHLSEAHPIETQKVGDAPAKAEPDPPVLLISQGYQSKEFRLGKTFSVKKAKGLFTLKLQEGLEDSLLITGPRTQELIGQATGSWRIGRNDIDAEVVLSVQSKPGSKWQVQTSVHIPSEAGGPLVPLSPGDPAAVLGRLGQYNSWLTRTADQWKFSATGKTQPGQPSPSQMARLYTAKQKETEKAIHRWRQIEQLAVLVFDAVSVQVELHPEPIAPNSPEHRPR